VYVFEHPCFGSVRKQYILTIDEYAFILLLFNLLQCLAQNVHCFVQSIETKKNARVMKIKNIILGIVLVALTSSFESNLAEDEISSEDCVTTPLERSIAEEDISVESWMVVPFMSIAEEEVFIETWMTTPFDAAQEILVEDWMTSEWI